MYSGEVLGQVMVPSCTLVLACGGMPAAGGITCHCSKPVHAHIAAPQQLPCACRSPACALLAAASCHQYDSQWVRKAPHSCPCTSRHHTQLPLYLTPPHTAAPARDCTSCPHPSHLLADVHVHRHFALRLQSQLSLARLALLLVLSDLLLHAAQHGLQGRAAQGSQESALGCSGRACLVCCQACLVCCQACNLGFTSPQTGGPPPMCVSEGPTFFGACAAVLALQYGHAGSRRAEACLQ